MTLPDSPTYIVLLVHTLGRTLQFDDYFLKGGLYEMDMSITMATTVELCTSTHMGTESMTVYL